MFSEMINHHHYISKVSFITFRGGSFTAEPSLGHVAFHANFFSPGGVGGQGHGCPQLATFSPAGVLFLLWKVQFMSDVIIRQENRLLCISKPFWLHSSLFPWTQYINKAALMQ